MEKFSVLQLAPRDSDDVPKLLGNFTDLYKVMTPILMSLTRNRIALNITDTQKGELHSCTFDVTGSVVFVNHSRCSDRAMCRYTNLKKLNRRMKTRPKSQKIKTEIKIRNMDNILNHKRRNCIRVKK